jgi:hypothetical protein
MVEFCPTGFVQTRSTYPRVSKAAAWNPDEVGSAVSTADAKLMASPSDLPPVA